MEDHILEEHFEKGKDNLFHCVECNFTYLEKNNLGRHYKSLHKGNPNNEVDPDNHDEQPEQPINNENDETLELSQVKAELKVWKRNFQRLETMYQESLEEVNTVKSEYEAKLIMTNDQFGVIKAENETLKKKVDILFKLGKSFFESEDTADPNKRNNKTYDKIEVLEEEEIDLTNDDLEAWTKKKMRGFKRTTPTSKSIPKEVNNKKSSTKKN